MTSRSSMSVLGIHRAQGSVTRKLVSELSETEVIDLAVVAETIAYLERRILQIRTRKADRWALTRPKPDLENFLVNLRNELFMHLVYRIGAPPEADQAVAEDKPHDPLAPPVRYWAELRERYDALPRLGAIE